MLKWLTVNVWLAGAIAGAIALVASWDYQRGQRQIEQGVRVERQRTEGANARVKTEMGTAARGTVDGRVRGQRDPNAVDK